MKKSTQVAQLLLDIAGEQEKPLTPMALLKLVYLCHGWMLGLYDRPLITEDVEAWKYGPVIPELYHALKKFGGQPVSNPIEQDMPEFDDLESALIRRVFEVYGNNGLVLSGLTHRPGTPWSATWERGSSVIPNESIQQHFKELAAKAA
jgi:uncharacterized phage-associated protein